MFLDFIFISKKKKRVEDIRSVDDNLAEYEAAM
jgi:hypothetical protein